ncbi:tetratricopeptide repeat protein [Sessilibacter corallicola]|uniref:tetratricopeptide repeat protein n=1 Tax=Sessilibacter corallicola TaxID=2904075 RepID=UPI001E2B8097|nr:tetratricopeptide repeat protein [Sessilibacter corallicola]MCE2027905.1 tetratricopeptide repeat protein [Sessilibacter corallicola]
MALTRKIDLIKLYETHTCLIVDDMPEMRGAIKRMIVSQGMARIDTAANAPEAISMCETRAYSMIICDYNLGKSQDGQQLLENLRHRKLLTPVGLFIMITAESSREMVLGAIESQPDDYITKPFTPKQLCLRLDRVLIKHEALLPIKKLFADKQYSEAVTLCEQMINNNSEFAFEINRMKGRILFLLGDLHRAREHYEKIVEQRPLPWAMLGLAETLVELGAYDHAEIILNKIVKIDHRYVEAHDLLARVHLEQSDIDKAQSELEQACELSPKSALRQRRLAHIAERNGDIKTSLKSYQQSIKWGSNSIHEDDSDLFNFARKAAELVRTDTSKPARDLADKAVKQLARMCQENPDNLEIQLKADLISASINQLLNKPNADQKSEEVRQQFHDNPPDDAECHLDFVKVLQDCGDDDEAQEHLQAMAAEFSEDKDVLTKIERSSSEPLTDESRKKVAILTKSGIASYQSKDYLQAGRTFQEALSVFPNHVGLNLNLVQVLLEQHNGKVNERDAASVERCFDRIQHIHESDPQAQRAQTLKAQFKEAKRVESYTN